VASDDHGAALPAGGGQPGKVYLAYAAALKARDAAALKTLMVARRVSAMEQAEKAGELKEFMQSLADDHDMVSVKVGKGFATADTAVLQVSGTSPLDIKRSGEVILRKEKDVWRVSAERVGMVLD
jgi:hypothetical protein